MNWIVAITLFIWLVFSSFLACIRALFYWGDWSNVKFFNTIDSWGAEKITGVKIYGEGLEHSGKYGSTIYVGNHQSAFDVPVFGKFHPPGCTLITKKELIFVPLFGFLLKASSAIMIDRKNKAKALHQIESILSIIQAKNLSLGFFPEGTRNKTDQDMMPFKRGAFHTAIQMQLPIVPMVSSNIRDKALWEKALFVRGSKVVLRFLPPIETKGLTQKDAAMLAELTRTKMLEAYHEMSSPNYIPQSLR